MGRSDYNIISIIPARSGSTRVKDKNIRLLGGRPLISYTIKSSLKSEVSRTIVSTDDNRIANIARREGAEVPFLRPKKISTSKTSAFPVVLHCLEYLKRSENYFADYVVYLQPTSPFRNSKDINLGLERIISSDSTSLTSISSVYQHPLWMFKKDSKHRLIPFLRNKNKPERSQDLPALYYVNGALTITKGNYFKSKRQNKYIIDFNDVAGLELDPVHALDIDTEIDLEIAQCLVKKFNND
ncbi:MAG: acylneuraminate cytidylyltransferase family protein [Nitrosopumilaceae archaeon]